MRCMEYLADYNHSQFKIHDFQLGSVSAFGTGRIRLESPRPAMPDTEPILTGMAPCPALHFSYKFPGSK